MAKNLTNFEGIPEQYLPMFKAGISVVNAGMYFEEVLRNQVGLIKITPKRIKVEGDKLKTVDISDYLIAKGRRAIGEMKTFNDVVNQVFMAEGKDEAVIELGYTLAEVFNEICYLSLDDQKRVANYVKRITKKSDKSFILKKQK